MAPGITAWCDRTMADVRLLDTGYFEMGRASRSVRRTSTTMKSTTGAFVVTNSCNASGDMSSGCECGSGNDSAQALAIFQSSWR